MPDLLSRLDTAPGEPSSYIIPALAGEAWTIPTSNSAFRFLATGKETEGAFAIVSTRGNSDKPIGFHYHNEAHDVFLCMKGRVNVWAGDQARTLEPGDFASAPPKTIHQYQVLATDTEFLGLIIPGGWEEFFRFVGESFQGILYPTDDHRNPMEVLIPKLMAAVEKHDLVPLPRHENFPPQPWQETDNVLPDKTQPYFLRRKSGPAFTANGTICRPMITTTQTAEKFSIASIEGSSKCKFQPLGTHSSVSFHNVHHCLYVVEGALDVTVEGKTGHLIPGDSLFIPAGSRFSFDFAANFVETLFFSNGCGIAELFSVAGKACDSTAVPRTDTNEVEQHTLAACEERFGFTLS